MKELQDRIVTFVTKSNGLVSMNKLVAVASAAAFSESEVLQALSTIGKRLKSTVRGGVVYYQVPPPPKTPTIYTKPDYPECTITAYGQPIPFYDPEYDGPTPVYSKETDKFYREKNEARKRAVERERFKRPVVYNKKSYAQKTI